MCKCDTASVAIMAYQQTHVQSGTCGLLVPEVPCSIQLAAWQGLYSSRYYRAGIGVRCYTYSYLNGVARTGLHRYMRNPL